MLLYRARFPSGDTDSETRARVWGGGASALGGWGWPEIDSHCLTDPSADTESVVSSAVHATPQTASE
jgi:hypothetical protein